MQSRISLAGAREAQRLIKPLINHTPALFSESLSQLASSSSLNIKLFFKCENLQKSGSFKFRGASNFIAGLPDSSLKRGLVAVSTGEIPILKYLDCASNDS